LLRPYGISSCNLSASQKVLKGYERKDFEDAWQRYLPFYRAGKTQPSDASPHLAEQVPWNQGA